MKNVLVSFCFMSLSMSLSAQIDSVEYRVLDKELKLNQPTRLFFQYCYHYDRNSKPKISSNIVELIEWFRGSSSGTTPNLIKNNGSVSTGLGQGIDGRYYSTTCAAVIWWLLPKQSGIMELPTIKLSTNGETFSYDLDDITVSKKRIHPFDLTAYYEREKEFIEMTFVEYGGKKVDDSPRPKKWKGEPTRFEPFVENFPSRMSPNDTLELRILAPKGENHWKASSFEYSGFSSNDFYILTKNLEAADKGRLEASTRQRDIQGPLSGFDESPTVSEPLKAPGYVTTYYRLVPKRRGRLKIDLGTLDSKEGFGVRSLGKVKVLVKE